MIVFNEVVPSFSGMGDIAVPTTLTEGRRFQPVCFRCPCDKQDLSGNGVTNSSLVLPGYGSLAHQYNDTRYLLTFKANRIFVTVGQCLDCEGDGVFVTTVDDIVIQPIRFEVISRPRQRLVIRQCRPQS